MRRTIELFSVEKKNAKKEGREQIFNLGMDELSNQFDHYAVGRSNGPYARLAYIWLLFMEA